MACVGGELVAWLICWYYFFSSKEKWKVTLVSGRGCFCGIIDHHMGKKDSEPCSQAQSKTLLLPLVFRWTLMNFFRSNSKCSNSADGQTIIHAWFTWDRPPAINHQPRWHLCSPASQTTASLIPVAVAILMFCPSYEVQSATFEADSNITLLGLLSS